MGSADIDALIKAATLLAEQDYVVLLGSDTGKLVAAVGKSGLECGVKAGDMIRAAAKALGGGGGGRAELAQGGGPQSTRMREALDEGLKTIHPCEKHMDLNWSLEKLIEVANADNNPMCRGRALREIANRKAIEAIEPIFQILVNKDEIEFVKKMYAIPALVSMGSDMLLNPIMQKLDDPDETVRSRAIDVLGEFAKKGNATAIEALKKVAKEDNIKQISGKAKFVLTQVLSWNDSVGV
jgi:hypothetical protein